MTGRLSVTIQGQGQRRIGTCSRPLEECSAMRYTRVDGTCDERVDLGQLRRAKA